MDPGHPELIARLVARVTREGPISFADFMEAVLYDHAFGYYTTGARVGLEGDFFTSPHAHALFAERIGRQIAQAADRIAPAGAFTIVEMGGGKGLLARDLLHACRREHPALLARLHYVLVERSPAMANSQREALHALVAEGVRITWLADLEELPTGSVTGIILSNELVDAFPVHRVVMRPQGLREIFVGWSSAPPAHPLPGAPIALPMQGVNERDGLRGNFREIEGSPSSPALQAYFDRLGIRLESGQRAEVNLRALDWMHSVGRALNRGLVITIDYGHTAADLYAPIRREGTLLCYYQHTVCDTPYVRIGRQDITAHVNFTSLALAGQEAGLAVTGYTNQLHFLMGLDIESAFAGVDPESAEAAWMRELLRPGGMGTTYKILVQHKGMPQPELAGLRSLPYRAEALYAGVPQRSPLSADTEDENHGAVAR